MFHTCRDYNEGEARIDSYVSQIKFIYIAHYIRQI